MEWRQVGSDIEIPSRKNQINDTDGRKRKPDATPPMRKHSIRRLVSTSCLEVVLHGRGDQTRLAEVAEIGAGAKSRDTARAESGPVVHIRDVVDGDAPSGHV